MGQFLEGEMNIETTTCLSVEHLELLQYYSKLYNIPIRTIISSMINYAVHTEKYKVQRFKRLSYRSRNGKWVRFHLCLFEDEYEFFLDVKKVWKMSLAKIIAFCIDNVLFDLIRLLIEEDDTDNYRYKNYTFGFFMEEGVFCCHFYWGLHPELIRKALT